MALPLHADVRRALEAGVIAAMEKASRDVMVWGKDDCALWCANIRRDVMGDDLAAEYRGRYRTRHGARRILGPKGLLGALRKAARKRKWKRIDPRMAQVGDVGIAYVELATPRGPVPVPAMVACRSSGWFVGRNERGFTAIPAHEVSVAWSVLDDMQPGAHRDANFETLAGRNRIQN